MCRYLLVGLVLMVSPFFAAADANHKVIEYSKVNAYVEMLKTNVHSELLYMRSYLQFKDDSIAPDTVKVWLTQNDQFLNDLDLTFNQQQGVYELDLPYFSEQEAQMIRLHINQDENAIGLAITTGLLPPAQSPMHYRDLFVVLDDVNAFTKKMAGVASWFVPEMDALKFTFEQPATVAIRQEDVVREYTTDNDLAIEIEKDERLMELNPLVEFSQLPTSMSPED